MQNFQFPDWTSYGQRGPVAQQGFSLPSYTQPVNPAPEIPNLPVNGVVPTPSNDQFTGMQKWLGGRNAEGVTHAGYLPTGLNVASGITSMGIGLANLADARKANEQAQENWAMNWDAQASTTNAELADRQRRRNAASGGSGMSADEYIEQYGINKTGA